MTGTVHTADFVVVPTTRLHLLTWIKTVRDMNLITINNEKIIANLFQRNLEI